MAKGRVGLYAVQGTTLSRTHKYCPKCGPGTFLAEHANRRSCGHCGYSESKAPTEKPTVKPPKGAKPAAPKPA